MIPKITFWNLGGTQKEATETDRRPPLRFRFATTPQKVVRSRGGQDNIDVDELVAGKLDYDLEGWFFFVTIKELVMCIANGFKEIAKINKRQKTKILLL